MMNSQENGSWYERLTAVSVFSFLFLSGISVILFGRFGICTLFVCAGIAAAALAFLYNLYRKRPNGRLVVFIACAILCAFAGIGAIALIGDALIHSPKVTTPPAGAVAVRPLPADLPSGAGTPGQPANGTRPAEQWTPLAPDRLGKDLNDTPALLTLPVGGFEYGRVWVSSGDPDGFANYTLFTRNLTPATVEIRIYPVKEVRSAEAVPPYADIQVSVTPDTFAVLPDHTYTTEVRVNLTSDRYDDTLRLFPYYLEVRSSDGQQMIAGDWVLVYAGDASVPGVSGFYRGHASLADSGREISVPAGGTGTATYLFASGIGGTGFVQYNLSLVSGDLNMMPMPREEKKPFPAGMQVSISPNNYTARSFGYYPSVITVKTDPDLLPGDYPILIEADGLGTNDQCVVHVVPAG